MKRFLITILILLSALFVSGCSNIINTTPPSSVGEITYDNDDSWGYQIYLKENDKFVPFIVLSSDYNGNCLVMRKYLLENCISYNSPGEYGSYYNGSNVDSFLNNQYYPQLSEKLKSIIVESEIEITTKNAIDTHIKETETITRNIFLLSANEVNSSLSKVAVKEGEVLLYFKSIENRISTFENLEASSWMLRTAALSDGNTVIGVSESGSVGIGGINTINGLSENAIRPVFCIPTTTPIVVRDDVIEGQSVFCLEGDF